MVEIPNLTKEEGQVTVTVDEDDNLVIPDVNNPPWWITVNRVNRETVSVGHENGESECGFDLTTFDTRENFVKMLESVGLDPYWDYCRVNPSRQGSEREYYYYVWVNEDGMILCGNNPITGNYRDGQFKEYGYASYIGVEGTEEFVNDVYQMIIQYGNWKDVSRNHRDFI